MWQSSINTTRFMMASRWFLFLIQQLQGVLRNEAHPASSKKWDVLNNDKRTMIIPSAFRSSAHTKNYKIPGIISVEDFCR